MQVMMMLKNSAMKRLKVLFLLDPEATQLGARLLKQSQDLMEDHGLWFRVWGLGFRVWGLGFRVWGLGFRVWGLGFGVWGLGFGVWGLGWKAWRMPFESQLVQRCRSMRYLYRPSQ